MNDNQRKFLIQQVEKTCRAQVEELENQIPVKPSLNNYLVAAFLDNSIEFSDIKELKKKMREMVLKQGKEDVLVHENSSGSFRYKRAVESNEVHVIAEDLFIIPENYKTALAEYEKKKSEIDDKIRLLNSTKDTIVMKIQIGSSSTMDKLVMQIDNMGDLDLVNTQLLLTGTEKKS